MATRKLIVAALCCGLAILLAGGLWLVATASSNDSTTSPLLSIGESATVGDLVITVTRSDLVDGALATVVDISLSSESGGAVDDLASGWAALSPTGEQLSLVAPPPLPSGAPPLCAAATVAPGATQECLLFFGSGEGATSSTGYTVVYKSAEGSAAWVVT